MSNDPSKRAPHPYTEFRPLPAYPNLEFERKAAKKLLASLRRGDADAIGRARAQKASGAAPAGAHQFKLADAQFIVAREYGFMSWPKLVHYYEAISRQEWTRHNIRLPDGLPRKVCRGAAAGAQAAQKARWQNVRNADPEILRKVGTGSLRLRGDTGRCDAG